MTAVLTALVAAPAPALAHLRHMTDSTGLFEHAAYAEPRRDHGYCVDDNARAVIVTERELARDPAAATLFDRCLRFVLAAQYPDGRFHNRRRHGEDRWADRPGTGDHWGRALWALGRVASRPDRHPLTAAARAAFVAGAAHRSPHPHAMAYAALGAAEVLSGGPTAQEAAVAARLLADAVTAIGGHSTDGWPWPLPRLTYANARLPEALIAAGVALRDATALGDGLRLLRWLARIEDRGPHLSFTPVGGWRTGEPRPAFDQQPIEAWAMADAAARALHVTGEPHWGVLIARCVAWFDGANDTGVTLGDPVSGGGCDGLTATGRNENQGAESTLSRIATLQVAEAAGVAGRAAGIAG